MTNLHRLSLSGLAKGTCLDGRKLAPGTVLFEGTLASGITEADFVLLTRRHGLEIQRIEEEADTTPQAKRKTLQGAKV